MITLHDRFRGSLLGLAVGDALGAPVEFKERGSFPEVLDFQDGGPFNLKKGQWTDDTSLALCLGISLLEKKQFDPADQVERYLKWFREGYMSCTGHCFDIGNTTKAALLRYEQDKSVYAGSPDDPATNGSLMRLAPIPLFYFPDEKSTAHYSRLSSKVTHAPIDCMDTCELLGKLILGALSGKNKEELKSSFDHKFLQKDYSDLSGKGQAWTCLESALWCFFNTSSFEEGVLLAVNLGDDTDTTAAVFGQLAGAFYGQQAIPQKWLDGLWDRETISQLADQLYLNQAAD